MPPKILVVENDQAVLGAVSATLRAAGFRVTRSGNGTSALAKARRGRPSLIICDAQFPRLTGLKLCRLLKKGASTRHIPVILLSAQATEPDRIEGFELGADDYIAKPFHAQELVLRVRRSLQRAADKFPPKEKIVVGELALDPLRHEVTLQDNVVTLTVLEFNLLEFLMENHGTVLDRETLLEEVWGHTLITRALDQQLSRLRVKLGTFSGCLETVQGIGYRLSMVPTLQASENITQRAKLETPWHSARVPKGDIRSPLRKAALAF